MDDLGCKTHIEKRVLKIIKGAIVVLKAKNIVANLYMFKEETHQEVIASIASTSSVEEMTTMWHQKLSHMLEKGLKVLSDQKLILGLTKVSLPFCEYCVTSKQHRLKFSSSTAKAKLFWS